MKQTLILPEKIQLIHENEEKYNISIDSVSNIIKRTTECTESYEQNESLIKKSNLRDEFSQQLCVCGWRPLYFHNHAHPHSSYYNLF
jgi:hypothetical protein